MQPAEKAKKLVSDYEKQSKKGGDFSSTIKWSETLKRRAKAGVTEKFSRNRILKATYRPFFSIYLYQSSLFIDRPGAMIEFFPPERRNRVICFTDPTSQKPFMVIGVESCPDLHLVGAAAGSVTLPINGFSDGESAEIVTDWAVEQFKKQYQSGRGKSAKLITRKAIFHYVYGVLHDPVYREKYAQNLKREFPRIPFYPDFWQWAVWGEILMDLHIGYEKVKPFKLKRTNVPDEKARAAKLNPKATLKADKDGGRIVLDSETTLSGVPPEAWEYKLGNRSALEWILDQYKEKKPKDPTIREKFDTYRFADYKEKVIDLLLRVTTVSMETVAIVEQMKAAARG